MRNESRVRLFPPPEGDRDQCSRHECECGWWAAVNNRPPPPTCRLTGSLRADQPRAFSTSLVKEPLGREPENWCTTSPPRTTANVGMELTP